MKTLYQRILEIYRGLPAEASASERVIVLLNLMIPVICLGFLGMGAILIWRKSRWGYYLVLIGLLGLAVEWFFFGS